jgi:transposase
MAHISADKRSQGLLFSQPLDELVGPDNPVRVIDRFVDTLELGRLGFTKVQAAATGRPPYAPGDLLKLYVYGYLNVVRSSRRLERQAQCNVEVMWLINRLTPSFKTIADFRKDHPEAIVGVCRAFVQYCRGLSLYGGAVLAIDGSKVEAVASRKKVLTAKVIARRTAAIDRRIADYLASLDAEDGGERRELLGRDAVAGALAGLPEQRARLQEAARQPLSAAAGRIMKLPASAPAAAAPVADLQAAREGLQQMAQRMAAQGHRQVVLGEAEARLMLTARHGHQVAYNVQSVVDAQHKLIAAFDLTNEGNDQCQLYPMAVQGRDALQAQAVRVVADAGYSNGWHGRLCRQAGIVAVVPRAGTVNPHDARHFSRERFAYDAASDTWRCPAGQTLSCQLTSHTEEKKKYWTDACGECALKGQCTGAARRTITRSFHEDDREAMHRRAMSDPAWMRLRRATVEHPFGTMKWQMGYPRFLVRGLRKAKAELALTVLGYNLKRVINIVGVRQLLDTLQPAPA